MVKRPTCTPASIQSPAARPRASDVLTSAETVTPGTITTTNAATMKEMRIGRSGMAALT